MAKIIEKKVTFKHAQPNILIQTWLLQLLDYSRKHKISLTPMLEQALDSVSKYPLQLHSGAECIILKGFQKNLCNILDQCIEAYNATVANDSDSLNELDVKVQNTRPDSPMPVSLSSSSTPFNKYIHQSNNTSIQELDNISVSSSRKYKPAFRSGGYAILLALREYAIENLDKPVLSKEHLIERAQKYSEESFVKPKPDTHYTAWSNMTRLVMKGFVKRNGKKKAKYALTKEGMALAGELFYEAKRKVTVNDIIFNNEPLVSPAGSDNEMEQDNIDFMDVDDSEPSTSQSQNIGNVFIDMPPGTFDIILLIDKCETGGLKKKNDPTVAQFNKYPDMKHEFRSLKVGDFTWVARHKENLDQELVLPFVVERKRMDDLGASIKDGRFHEQKFRLRKCGLNNVIYLVENFGSNRNVGLPLQHLKQALANTRVQDGFKVHTTDSLTSSVRFLAMMTKRLIIRFKDKHLQGYNKEPTGDYLMTFDYFNKSSAKNKALTVTETFIKLLLQLKGVSVEKALAITRKYPTPRSLIKAYLKCNVHEGRSLLTYLKYSELSPNVGSVISKAIYNVFSSIENT